VEIPAILEEKTLLRRDKSGQPHFSMPAMDLWSNVVHNADNVRFVYHDSALGKNLSSGSLKASVEICQMRNFFASVLFLQVG